MGIVKIDYCLKCQSSGCGNTTFLKLDMGNCNVNGLMMCEECFRRLKDALIKYFDEGEKNQRKKASKKQCQIEGA